MKITNHIEIDMAQRLPIPPVSAVQNDANTRVIEVTALENGQKWKVPDGVTPAVAFRKPDGRKGLYDELPDGTKAVTFLGNVITAVLAPQVLTCSGQVHVAIVLMDANLNRLATFPFIVDAAQDPSGGSAVSSDYYKYSTMEAVSEAVDAALSELETSKQDFLDKAVEALEVVKGAATEDAPAIICEAKGEVITASDASNRSLAGLTIYGKTTQNGTPTPESPVPLESVGDSGSIGVTVAGKNLLPKSAFHHTDNYGVFRDTNMDGSVALKGTSTQVFVQGIADAILPAGTYTYSTEIEGTFNGLAMQLYSIADNSIKDKLVPQYAIPSSAVFTLTEKTHVRARFYCPAEVALDCTVRFQIEKGSAATAYEPYTAQTLTAQTPNGLPGIPLGATIPDVFKNSPVHMAGVWWDEETQQYYISDTIDFAKGVYVQRVLLRHIRSSDSWIVSQLVQGRYYLELAYSNKVLPMCTHFKPVKNTTTIEGELWCNQGIQMLFHTGFETLDEWKKYLDEKEVYVAYALDTPIETPISAEELAQYAALHSNKPTTTVYNDAGADMKLEYVADTKLYIDQKLAAISAALLNA